MIDMFGPCLQPASRTATLTDPVAPDLVLRPYQLEALAAVELAEQRGIRRQLIALPTGTGKTVVFSHLAKRRGGRTLILVHRDELVRQTVDKLHTVTPGSSVGVVKAGEDETTASTVVASVQTLRIPRRLARLQPDFHTVIVDEAHHAIAESYCAILEHVRGGEPDGPLLTGWTATPERGDRLGLNAVFDEIVFERDILTMITAGYLSDLRAVKVVLEVNLDTIHTRRGDFVEGELGTALMNANAPSHILDSYQQHAAGRRALLFAPTVKMAYATAETFRAGGVAAAALDGTTPLEERRAILASFRRGEIMMLANNLVLTEGFDDPGIECIIAARPTESRPLFVQMVGRGTRLYPGKQDCLILDVVGSTSRHKLQTVASLFGVDPSELGVGQETVAEAIGRQQAAADALAGRLIAATVDLFKGRRMNWLQVGDRWVLTTGKGQLSLDLNAAGAWSATRYERNQAPAVLAENVPLDYAQGIAEDTVRQAGAQILTDRSAPWRTTPASEKQLALLKRYRIQADPEVTKGEASDLIDLHFAKRRGSPVTAGR